MGVALPALYQKILKGKYRNESTRLQYWDYGSDGVYFITIGNIISDR